MELRINVQQIKDTMAGRSSNKIENLNNQNYQTWKFKMELLLIKEDLWETVTKEIPDPVTAEWQTKYAKARAIIGLQVADNKLHLIRKQTTAKGSWQTLKKYHEKATLSSKVNLLKRLRGLKLTEHGDMENHLAEMQNLIDQLASLGEPLAEHLSVALFLNSFPDSYGTLITALETIPEEDLTTELVKGKLLEEFKRRSNVFSMQNELESKVLKMTKTEVKPKPPLTCFFCKKPNHVKKECRKYIECIVLYCIVSINLYSASCSAHQSEALPVRETQREESSPERTKRRTRHTSQQSRSSRRKELAPKRRANDCKGSCLSHRSPRPRDTETMTVR